MKKILLFISVIFVGISLTACNFGQVQTTTTTEELTTVDYDNLIEINTVEDLKNMAMNKSYILMADLDLQGEEWSPIGDYLNPFLGNFDGNDHTISNLTISNDDSIYNGLFGKVYGNIEDLNIENISIVYETDFLTYAGGLAGFTEGSVTNVSVTGNISIVNEESNSYVGLLVGYSQARVAEYLTAQEFIANVISESSAVGTINLKSESIAFVGGFIGKSFNSEVSNNFSDVDLTVELNKMLAYVGGFIGHNFGGILVGFESLVEDANIYIKNNVSNSDISVKINEKQVSLGGFIGYNHFGYNLDNYSNSTITLTGEVTEYTEVNLGAYIGENWYSEVVNTVAIYDLTNSLESGYILRTQTYIVGQNLSEKTFENNFIACTSEQIDVSEISELTLITDTEYNSTDFYTDSLNWDNAQISKILE